MSLLWPAAAAILCLLPVRGEEGPINCFRQVDESKWSLVVEHNATTSSLAIVSSGAGPHVITCLNRQPEHTYRVSVVGDADSQDYVNPWEHTWEGSSASLVARPPVFHYLIFGGRYRVEFAVCELGRPRCDSAEAVSSDYINIQSEMRPGCIEGANNSSRPNTQVPSVEGMSGRFRFSFTPCSDILPYDGANITLYESTTKEECGTTTTPLLSDMVPVSEDKDRNALIDFRSPEVEVRERALLNSLNVMVVPLKWTYDFFSLNVLVLHIICWCVLSFCKKL